jgi:hypothetical protein
MRLPTHRAPAPHVFDQDLDALQSSVDGLEHDPEKWGPVFGKDHAQTKGWSGMPIQLNLIPL